MFNHPLLHTLFETLSYVLGGMFYRALRRQQGDTLTDELRWSMIAAMAIGAVIGSRILGLAEQYPRVGFQWHWLFQPGGKTIVGGLLGGWIAVELAKRLAGIHSRTGDLFALPLCLGIAIGRIGCLFAGLADDTYGTPTSLPWGIDVGDGVLRHPVQIYEIIFLALLAFTIYNISKRPHRQGVLFRVFLAGYLAWRLAVDFIKPQPLVYGMNIIQWACVFGLVALAVAAIGHPRTEHMEAIA